MQVLQKFFNLHHIDTDEHVTSINEINNEIFRMNLEKNIRPGY